MTISSIELAEAQYNARDVLSTCRVYSPLLDALERNNVTNVYEVDEQMADLAIQMTRAGMPVNEDKRAAIGERLRTLRDSAIETLKIYTEDPYREDFITWAARFMATKARKGEPTAGSLRVGPTRAAAALDELRAMRMEWGAFKRKVKAAMKVEGETPQLVVDLAEAEAQLMEIKARTVETKQDFINSQTCIDEEDGLIHTAETAFDARMAIRKAQFLARIEKKGISYSAKIQQCAILRAAAVPLLQVTAKTGLPKIDKEVLESLNRHPAAKALLAYILTEKTINMYCEGELRLNRGSGGTRPFVVSDDGYCHALWTIHKITGRWGSSPNIQNWSKRAGGGAENLRHMVEAPEGYTFVEADQKQLEARLIGAMSKCEFLLKVFREGRDIHGEMAGVGFPKEWPALADAFKAHKKAPVLFDLEVAPEKRKCSCPMCKMRDKIRDITKRLEYGGFYGGAPKTLWESVVGDFPDFQMSQVFAFMQAFNQCMPEVMIWREMVLREATMQREIRSPILGRRQVFPLGRLDPTVAYNYKAQSGGADLWALGAIEFMKRWDQRGVDARLIHNGHDSVLILCRIELAPQVEQDVYACWNREWQGVPFEMEAKISPVWG